MANEIRLTAAAAKTNVKALIVAQNGTVWSGSALVALSTLNLAAWRAALIACTELVTADTTGMGVYVANWPGGLTEDAIYSVLFWEGATPSPNEATIGQQDDPTEYLAAQVGDVYHAAINLTIDEANTQDEYTAVWFKNGVRITSGITSPTIQAIDRADGSDLIAETAMSAIGATGGLSYDEATNRITEGESVIVIVSATIGGAARSFADVLSRDSTA